jgi:hypothetical protein
VAPRFLEPMECLPVQTLPEGASWTYELKPDGYRTDVVRSGRRALLYSRRGVVLNERFPKIVALLSALPDGAVLDGELVALGPDGRPNFELLQDKGLAHIFYTLSTSSSIRVGISRRCPFQSGAKSCNPSSNGRTTSIFPASRTDLPLCSISSVLIGLRV